MMQMDILSKILWILKAYDLNLEFFNHFEIWLVSQRFKIIYFLMGPWDPQTMILMGPRAVGMGPTIDVCICWKF